MKYGTVSIQFSVPLIKRIACKLMLFFFFINIGFSFAQPVNTSVKPDIEYMSHTVKQKETLFSISIKYNVPVEAIKEENKLKSEALKINQKLVIPLHIQMTPKATAGGTAGNYTGAGAVSDSAKSHVSDTLLPFLMKFYEQSKKEKEEPKKANAFPEVEDAQLLRLTNSDFLKEFCTQKYKAQVLDSSSSDTFKMKEYFLFLINSDGQVADIKDERKECNKNTKQLTDEEIGELKKLVFSADSGSAAISENSFAMGITMKVSNTHLKVKIKKDKIQIINQPLFVEYMKPSDPNYTLIRSEFEKNGSVLGKYEVTIQEGECSFDQYSKKGYNPFDKKKHNLLQDSFKIMSGFKALK